jgi:hypothetical protein
MTHRPRTITLQKGDEVTLQYLGAALVIQWSELSEAVQQTILQQASAIGGLPPLTSLSEQIKSLIWRTKEDNWHRAKGFQAPAARSRRTLNT